jgi:hypothetical protein
VPNQPEFARNADLPTISVVTPSFNHAPWLERTLRSILDPGYPRLELVVVDGGSTDGSVEIIRAFESRLAWWVSEPDRGQYDAINKGFAHTSGEIMAWLNSDDLYTPWALHVVGELFTRFSGVEWLTSLFQLVWDDHDRAVACTRVSGFNRPGFMRGENLGAGARGRGRWIQQESTFWRRSLWQRAGGCLDTSVTLAADFELWARYFARADLVGVETPLAGFRAHGDQRSATQRDAYTREAEAALVRHGGRRGGRLDAAWRTALIPRLPTRLRRSLETLHLAAPRPVCRWEGPETGWTLRWG